MGTYLKGMQSRRLITTTAVLIAVLIANTYLPQVINPYYYRIILLCGINIILAVSLNLINGFTGQFSLGHAGFFAVGAYTSAVLTHFWGQALLDVMTERGIPLAVVNPVLLALGMVVAIVFSALIGLLVALPSLRLKGDYLAIVTLGFGEAIRSIIENVDAVGAARGFSSIPVISSFGWIFMCVLGVILFSRALAMSTHGRALFAIREDELAAESVGINAFSYKTKAFVVGACWAGVAGALYAHLEGVLTPTLQTMGFMKSIEIVIMVVLGGMGSVTGSVIAAVIVTAMPEVLREVLANMPGNAEDYRMVIYSLLFIVLMLTRPQGIFGRHEFSPINWFRKITRSKRSAVKNG